MVSLFGGFNGKSKFIGFIPFVFFTRPGGFGFYNITVSPQRIKRSAFYRPEQRQKETDRRREEIDRQMKDTDRRVGELTNRFGDMVEFKEIRRFA
jgi:hypothetical protein